NIEWPIEEATYLNISTQIDDFFCEFETVLREFLRSKDVLVEESLFQDLFMFQKLSTCNYRDIGNESHTFRWNIPEYFETYCSAGPNAPLRKETQEAIFQKFPFHGSRELFAKQAIWFGRRDYGFLADTSWETQSTQFQS
ncbi:MAG: hypothetical protein QF645_13185, partial [Planctomycetota bacterium]|nr:hypothetical protein [Planctomycetota bacterium]